MRRISIRSVGNLPCVVANEIPEDLHGSTTYFSHFPTLGDEKLRKTLLPNFRAVLHMHNQPGKGLIPKQRGFSDFPFGGLGTGGPWLIKWSTLCASVVVHSCLEFAADGKLSLLGGFQMANATKCNYDGYERHVTQMMSPVKIIICN